MNISSPKTILVGAVITYGVLLSGCAATLADFQEMSANERADFICGKDEEIVDINDRISDVSTLIQDTEEALIRGYRVHRSCTSVPVIVQDYTCNYYSCYTTTRTKYKPVCTKTPVAIDGAIEEKKLAGYRNTEKYLSDRLSESLKECRSPLLDLTAEEAYSYYERARKGLPKEIPI